MVRMFMSYQDAGKTLGSAANGGEALAGLAAAEAGIN